MLAQYGAFAEGLHLTRLTEENNGPGSTGRAWEERHAEEFSELTGADDNGAAEVTGGLGEPEVGVNGEFPPPESGEFGAETKEDAFSAAAGEGPGLPEKRYSARQKYFKEKKRPRSRSAQFFHKAVSMGSSSELDGSVSDNSTAWHKLELKGAKAGTARAEEDDYKLWVPGTKYVLEPRCTQALIWMIFILIVTLFAAICTPLEIAWFSNNTDWASTNFFLVGNIVIIIIFTFDIVINFNLAYIDPENGYLVSSRRKIALNYMKFWFWIDMLATVPIDGIVLVVGGNGGAQVLRLFKLMRLFRIAKIMTSKRVLRLIEAEHAINYDAVSLVGFFASLLLLMHIMSCGLFMVAQTGNRDLDGEYIFYRDNQAGFSSYTSGVSSDDPQKAAKAQAGIDAKSLQSDDAYEYSLEGYNVFNEWLFGMYWSAMTVSTIGYGDVTLHTNYLRGYAIVCMLVGASAYAYMVGALINVVLNMNKREQERRNVLSEVNEMVCSVGLEHKYRRRIRMFFSKTDSGDGGLREYRPYFARLSPPLAAQVIRTMMKDWIGSVWWLERGLLDNNLVVGFAQLITEQSFAPREAIFHRNDAANAMYICTGNILVVGKGRIFASGKGVGEEILLPKRGPYGYSVHANSYVDALRIDRNAFREFVHSYPALHPRIRWTVLAIYVNRRGGARYLHETSSMEGRSNYELAQNPSMSSVQSRPQPRAQSTRNLKQQAPMSTIPGGKPDSDATDVDVDSGLQPAFDNGHGPAAGADENV